MHSNTLAENSYMLLFFVEPNFTLTSAEDEDIEVLPTPDTTIGLTRERKSNFFTRSEVIKLICDPSPFCMNATDLNLNEFLPNAVPRSSCEFVVPWHETALELFVTCYCDSSEFAALCNIVW
ncbi:unnamed protein product [Nezara viridula]|uniref:Uncharacterized protein n=1 Tax=Nezara viridula TaxID=85310 RepID=A0A9P0E573_NEZVI|nr:unnamed protein product [Nezara viridula]